MFNTKRKTTRRDVRVPTLTILPEGQSSDSDQMLTESEPGCQSSGSDQKIMTELELCRPEQKKIPDFSGTFLSYSPFRGLPAAGRVRGRYAILNGSLLKYSGADERLTFS
jgi:hypothetical protein